MKKRFFFVFLILVVFFSSFSSVSALMVSPDMKEIPYAPREEQNLHFTVSNFGEYGLIFEVEGEGANETVLLTDVKNCKSPCGVNVKYKVPYVDTPGRHELKIKFKESPPPAKYGQAGISAVAQIISPVYFIAPYPNKYLTVRAHTQGNKAKFQSGEKVYLVALVKSYGEETINSITGEMEIRSNDNSYLTTVPLTSVENLEYGSEAEMYAEWDTSDLERGIYYYNAKVNYDGEIVSHSWSLELGEELVEITALSPLTLSYGEINKLDAALKNYWNAPAEVYIKATLLSSERKPLADAESSTIDIEAGMTKNLFFYLDSKEVPLGNYTLQTETQFGADKSYKQLFNVTIMPLEKKSDSLKNISPDMPKSGKVFIYSVLVIIILALIGVVYFVVSGKKNEDDL